MTSKAICFVCSMTCSNPNLGKPIVSISGRVTNHLHPLRKTPNGSKSLAPQTRLDQMVAHPHSPHCSRSLGTFALPRRIPKQSCSPKRLLAWSRSWRSIPNSFLSEHQWCLKSKQWFMQPNLVNVSNRRWNYSVACEGLMGFEGKLNFTWLKFERSETNIQKRRLRWEMDYNSHKPTKHHCHQQK